MFGFVQGAVGLAAGLRGLFGSKRKNPTPRDNLLSQAQGAREAADKYGFNPLTMLQYGQTAGAMGGVTDNAPLASAQILMDSLQGLDDIVSGDAARRRAQQELQLDLAKLQLDQLRSGVIVNQVGAADQIGGSPSPLGRSAGAHHTGVGQSQPVNRGTNSVRPSAKPDASPHRLFPGRDIEIEPVKSIGAGVFVDNSLTGGRIVVPGSDGEIMGIDEAATLGVFGAPQVIGNHINNFEDAIHQDGFVDTINSNEYWSDIINNPGIAGFGQAWYRWTANRAARAQQRRQQRSN